MSTYTKARPKRANTRKQPCSTSQEIFWYCYFCGSKYRVDALCAPGDYAETWHASLAVCHICGSANVLVFRRPEVVQTYAICDRRSFFVSR